MVLWTVLFSAVSLTCVLVTGVTDPSPHRFWMGIGLVALCILFVVGMCKPGEDEWAVGLGTGTIASLCLAYLAYRLALWSQWLPGERAELGVAIRAMASPRVPCLIFAIPGLPKRRGDVEASADQAVMDDVTGSEGLGNLMKRDI